MSVAGEPIGDLSCKLDRHGSMLLGGNLQQRVDRGERLPRADGGVELVALAARKRQVELVGQFPRQVGLCPIIHFSSLLDPDTSCDPSDART